MTEDASNEQEYEDKNFDRLAANIASQDNDRRVLRQT
jgi:hypothetical protein